MSTQHSFLLDENIHLAVAEGLRRLELDVLHAREVDLLRASDEEIMAVAADLKRILVTRDIRDFGRLARLYLSVGRPLPGILLVPPSIPDKDPGALIHAIQKWAGRYGPVDQIPEGIAWLSPAELQDGDRRIQEPEPTYMRALQRIGANAVPGGDPPRAGFTMRVFTSGTR